MKDTRVGLETKDEIAEMNRDNLVKQIYLSQDHFETSKFKGQHCSVHLSDKILARIRNVCACRDTWAGRL